MSDAYVIEIAGEPAGIVARLHKGYAFYAARQPFHRLEARTFPTPWAAERAVRDLQAGRAGAPRGKSSPVGVKYRKTRSIA